MTARDVYGDKQSEQSAVSGEYALHPALTAKKITFPEAASKIPQAGFPDVVDHIDKHISYLRVKQFTPVHTDYTQNLVLGILLSIRPVRQESVVYIDNRHDPALKRDIHPC